ncbi:XRE family transcriptional regulator [Bacillus subtilis subsp. subtilis]|nr:XRE family transcriptional regulator [Bacillus subtilis subsp. subtilis]
MMLRKLRDTRLAQGKTQTYMAKQLGYRYASGYANIEMGRTKPSLEKAQQISELLDGDVNELFLMKSYTKRVKRQHRRLKICLLCSTMNNS